MNFSKINRQLSENAVVVDASVMATEHATQGEQKQKAQVTTQKSDTSYTSERYEREQIKMLLDASSNWRKDLNEAMGPDEEGDHPFVDVMPMVNRQQKGTKQAKEKAFPKAKGEMREEMTVKDQMKMAREAGKKRNPNPNHRDIRGKMLKSQPPAKDDRTDSQKMSDATGPRPGSRFRGD